MIGSNTRRGATGRFVVVLLAGLFAIVLIYLAVPRLAASLANLPGDRVFGRIVAREPVDADALRRLVESRTRALAWTAAPRSWTDLGLGVLLRARIEAGDDASAAREFLAHARRTVTAGLALGPINPYAWARLAFIEWHLGAPPDRIATLLKMSNLTGPVSPRLTFFRLDLAFRTWRYLADSDRRIVLRQIRSAWYVSADRLLALASTPLRRSIIRAALILRPALIAEYERRVRYRRPTGR